VTFFRVRNVQVERRSEGSSVFTNTLNFVLGERIMKIYTGVTVIVCTSCVRNTYTLCMKYNQQFSNSKHDINVNV